LSELLGLTVDRVRRLPVLLAAQTRVFEAVLSYRATPWLCLNCERCQHHAPLACAIAFIRWAAAASSDVLRQRARCTRRGHKGATIQHPGWGDADVGLLPFKRGCSNAPRQRGRRT
jgi:hypothetical protein